MILLLMTACAPSPAPVEAGCTATERDDVDADGNDDSTTTYVYDAFGRMVELHVPDVLIDWAYDAYGNVVEEDYRQGDEGWIDVTVYAGPFPLTSTVTDRDGTTVETAWDYEDGLVVGQSDGRTTYAWTYDDVRRPATERVTDPISGSDYLTEYSYSEDGRTTYTTQTDLVNGDVVERAQEVDARGNLVSESDGRGREQTYTYDDEDRMLGFVVVDDEGDVIARLEVEYEDAGPSWYRYTDLNGAFAEAYTYDSDGQMIERADDDDADGADDRILTYTYDADGRATGTETDEGDDGTVDSRTHTSWSCEG